MLFYSVREAEKYTKKQALNAPAYGYDTDAG